jgi:hypothetical protein
LEERQALGVIFGQSEHLFDVLLAAVADGDGRAPVDHGRIDAHHQELVADLAVAEIDGLDGLDIAQVAFTFENLDDFELGFGNLLKVGRGGVGIRLGRQESELGDDGDLRVADLFAEG